MTWLWIAIGAAAVAAAIALFLLRTGCRSPSRGRRWSRSDAGSRSRARAGIRRSAASTGTAYAVEIPEVKDAEQRAARSRFFVLDPNRRLPFWVDYSEVHTPLPPALQAHPGPWVGQRGLRPGTPVLGYVTVPPTVPERQAELYDQLARIEGLCKRRKFELLGVVRDVEPNGEDVLERPGIRYALERFGAHEASALVVADVNRLGGLAGSARLAAGTPGRDRCGAGGARAGARHLHGGGPGGRAPARDRPPRADQARRGGLRRTGREAATHGGATTSATGSWRCGTGRVAPGDRRCAERGGGPDPTRVRWRPASVRDALDRRQDPSPKVVPLKQPRFERRRARRVRGANADEPKAGHRLEKGRRQG